MNKKIKINVVNCNDILNSFGEITIDNYQTNMLKMFDIYYIEFKKQNPELFKIKTRIKWGIHKFKTLGDCLSEIILSLQNCDGNEYKRYKNDLNKIINLYNSGKLTENVIVLNGGK